MVTGRWHGCHLLLHLGECASEEGKGGVGCHGLERKRRGERERDRYRERHRERERNRRKGEGQGEVSGERGRDGAHDYKQSLKNATDDIHPVVHVFVVKNPRYQVM